MIEPSSTVQTSTPAPFDRRAWLRSIQLWRPSDLSIFAGGHLGDAGGGPGAGGGGCHSGGFGEILEGRPHR